MRVSRTRTWTRGQAGWRAVWRHREWGRSRWGGRVLGWQFQYMVDHHFGAKELREHVLKVFDGDAQLCKWVKGLPEEEVKQVAAKLKRGIFYASPVFDGAPEDAIKDTLTIS